MAALATLVYSAQASANSPEPALNGFYLGGFLGGVFANTDVTVEGNARRPTRTYSDEGAQGVVFGGVAGYGRLFAERLYLGAEIEIAVPHNVVGKIDMGANQLRSRLTTEGGLYVRLGYSPDGRNLVFLRGGAALPRQAVETASGRTVSDRWLISPAFGAGGEVALTPAWALRFDATYTAPGGENATDALRATVGLSYRF